ncbi:diaminopimelate decarboxylase [uncultured Aeromicrobium sp.]|uniref:diaminopimelate decarboxylase n=1 Tax=uncultured Aeromicrobium sp. TaxID=337820 RepID=UPI0025EC4971|nr:diaminopimelate decarboxylase [uncultured Aeromicrobium sp.]
MMRAHEAGALHGQAGDRGPAWLRYPEDVNALVPSLWAENVARRHGVVTVAGVGVDELAREFGTPLYVLDEEDFRRRARAFRDAFVGADVYYAGKAFLSVATARWIAEEGLGLDVCTGGELAVALRAQFPPERIGLHGNNKSIAELRRALEVGVGRIIVDSFDEIARLGALTGELGVRAPVMVRVTAGVEAHTHEYISTSHEDQKFGFSIAGGDAMEAVRRILADDGLDFRGLHSHIGSQIFVTDGFEVAARRVLRLHAQIASEWGVVAPELDLGGGFGIAYTTQDEPSSPQTLAHGMREIVEGECAALRIDIPRLSIEPGRAIAGPSMFTLYEIGTTKQVVLDGGGARHYVAVDGGMSDNIRPALYSADYSCTLASRESTAQPVLSRVVGKHCESGDIVVKDEYLPADVAPGDLLAVPGTGAYCRSLANNYNHVPRPAVVAVRDGEVRLLLRRETEDDLLALDLG